jgi:type IV pilus assembly protein PilV
MTSKMKRSGKNQGGFTLVESMLALLLLAIGLLAIAAMQDMAFSRNVDSNELSLVTNLTAEMIERIRFNARNVTAYNNIDTTNVGTKPPVATQPMASGDYDQWTARLGQVRLANVRGTVTVAATGPAAMSQNQVTVRVTWTTGVRPRAIQMVTVVTLE